MQEKDSNNLIPRLPDLMRRYGLLLVFVIAIPPAVFLGTEAVPAGYRPIVFGDRPGESAVSASYGPQIKGEQEEGIPHVPTPEVVKGIYITSATAQYTSRFDELVDFVDRTELNSLVIDVKNWKGELAFNPGHPSLQKYADEDPEIPDLAAFTAPLKEKGIYLIARIFVFQDPSYAEKHPELAVQHVNGGLWSDWRGTLWLDPAAKEVWRYNAAVAREAYAGGFDEIQFDYIRFPSDGPMSSVRYPVYDETVPKHEIMRGFFAYMDKELRKRSGIPLSVDLFGLTMWIHDNDMNIGQMLADAAPHADFISPMVYPSHYPDGWRGFANPAEAPYEIIKMNMEKGEQLLEQMRKEAEDPGDIATVRPWLQDFDLGAIYDAGKIRAQIDASMEEGASGWLFWNARNVYTEWAFEPSQEETTDI